MQEQINKADGVTLNDTNNRILAKKSEGYVLGVIINTLCKDMENDTELVRAGMLKELNDFSLNVKTDLVKYVRCNEESYDASIRLKERIGSVATKITQTFDKSNKMFVDLKVRCSVNSLRHVMELKKYAEIHGLHV